MPHQVEKGVKTARINSEDQAGIFKPKYLNPTPDRTPTTIKRLSFNPLPTSPKSGEENVFLYYQCKDKFLFPGWGKLVPRTREGGVSILVAVGKVEILKGIGAGCD